MTLDRRAVLAGLASLAAGPLAAADPLAEAEARAAGLDQLHALIVAQHGETRLARAFRGPPLDRPVNVKSVSKTIVATLTGQAIARGELRGVDQPVVELIDPPPGADPRVAEITVEDLLTLRAGLERTSGANYGAWVASRDWVADALSRPFVDEPGGRFLYSTGSTHALGAALAAAANKSLLVLARERLGAPLGVAIPPWTRDPQGRFMGGNQMALSPRALLRFGEAWRRGGLRGGARVIPQAWIAASWTPRARSPWSGHAYGYGWFLAEMAGRRVAYARGYGGQMLHVVPELGLTVVMTSDPTRPARSRGHVGALNALLAETIIPALAEAEAPPSDETAGWPPA
jgi:CubicO group peptidase (beta-lactamase class C family)